MVHEAATRVDVPTLPRCGERFSSEQAVVAGVDGGVATGAHAGTDLGMPDSAVRRGAVIYFLWLGGLMALVALIGFIPAIVVFIFVYMHFGFKEPAGNSAVYAFATAFLCWGLFHKLLAVAWPQSLLGDALPALRATLGFI